MIEQHGTLSISRSRFLNNVAVMRHRVGAGTQIAATVKADAYGHGIKVMLRLLREAGVDWVCVYTLGEAAAVARWGWKGVLVMAPMVLVDGGDEAWVKSLAPAMRVNVTDVETARLLSAAVTRAGIAFAVRVHVQVDTGLTRAGVEPERCGALVEEILELPGLAMEGVFAHLSHGDVARHATLLQQMGRLLEVARSLKARVPGLMVHLQNSGGTFHLESEGFDLVRVGIALYGLQPSMTDPIAGLLPVAQVTAPILAIHERPAGTGVGYGHTFVTVRATRVAVVPVGYADGYPRGLSNGGVVQVRGMEAPVVGRVSMDQILIDVTDVEGAMLGDQVVVVSNDPAKANCVDRLAEMTGTIGYELATRWGPSGSRVKRNVVE
jgi:alanine racemase